MAPAGRETGAHSVYNDVVFSIRSPPANEIVMMQPVNIRFFVGGRAARLGVAALLVASLASAPFANGATPPQRPSRASLAEFTKVELKSLAEKYQDFYDEVKVIITPEEEEVFFRLGSDFQRDEFLTHFWRVRDPSPGTPTNEYKDEYDRRLEHVEKHFGRGTPRKGRQTDRGRMYLLLGEPMNIKSFPWTQQAYPAEMWWFHASPRLGIPPFFYLVFFKRNGVGEFRLYSPLVDTPTALLNPAGMQTMRSLQSGENGRMAQMDGEIGAAYDVLLGVDAELAQVSLSLIPGDYGGQAGYGSMRSQMMMGDIESIPETIMPTASWSYPILTGIVEADVRFESLPMRARAIALLDPSGIPFVHYGLLTEGGRLNLNKYEDSYYITFEVAGTLVDKQNRIVTSIKGADGANSKVLQANLDQQEAARMRGAELMYLDRLPVVAGDYRFELVLENNVSREYGHEEFDLRVPQAWPEMVRSSPPLLAWEVYEDPQYDPYVEHYPFQVERFSIIPALDHRFGPNGGINIFQQVYLPRGFQGELSAVYRLLDNGDPVAEHSEAIDPARADRNGTINLMANFSLEGVPGGEYDLFIDIDGDDHGGVMLEVTVDLALSQDDIPHLHMNIGPPPTDPSFAFDRARQFRTIGQVDNAIETLASAVERVDDDQMITLQIELMMEAQRYDEVEQLLRPLQIERPNDTDILMALAAVSSQKGKNYEAIRYYERIRLVTNEENPAVLNPLASAYFGNGNLVKARQMLELSLEVDPDQPAVRRLLDDVLGKGQGGSR